MFDFAALAITNCLCWCLQDQERLAVLQSQHDYLYAKEQALRTQLEKEQQEKQHFKELLVEKEDLDKQVRSFQAKNAQLKEAKRSCEAALHRQLEEAQDREKQARAENNRLSKELAALSTQLKDRTLQAEKAQQAELELRITEQKVKNLESQLAQAPHDSSVIQSLRENSRSHSALRRDHSALQDNHRKLAKEVKNTKLLEEKLEDCKRKISTLEQGEAMHAELQAQHQELVRVHQTWLEMLKRHFPSASRPAQVTLEIQELQRVQASCVDKACRMESKAHLLDKQAQELRLKLQQSESLARQRQEVLSSLEKTADSLKLDLAVARKENASLEALLESFKGDESAQASLAAMLTKRVAQLQRQLEHCQDKLRQAASASASSASSASGADDGARLKVLHLKTTPKDIEAEQALQRQVLALQKQNEQLQAQYRSLKDALGGEAPAAASGFQPPTPSNSANNVSVERLEKLTQLLEQSKEAERRLSVQAEDAEKLIKRLKEVFQKKISQFREACYLLTGYKVDMEGQRYRLRSMYSEKEEDALMFQKAEGGPMHMLETQFVKRVDAELLELLHKYHSIPAFLSQLTLQLFERQTRIH
eukprot:g5475.t1